MILLLFLHFYAFGKENVVKESVLNKLLINNVVNKVEYTGVYIFYKKNVFFQIYLGI